MWLKPTKACQGPACLLVTNLKFRTDLRDIIEVIFSNDSLHFSLTFNNLVYINDVIWLDFILLYNLI